MDSYGKELILDLKDCDISKFDRPNLKKFFKELCKLIGMKRSRCYFWDYEGDEEAKNEAPAHLAGTTAVQFIRTSDIRIHTLDKLRTIYLNVFSCAEFDTVIAETFIKNFFNGVVTKSKVESRG